MDIVVCPTAAAAGQAAADAVAAHLTEAVGRRGRAAFAVSGGKTPGPMFERLAGLDLPWDDVHLFQVDERAVRLGDPDRNWGSLRLLTSLVPLTHQHAMPVEDPAADTEYAQELESVLGSPPVLDVVHLGLGDDGHTASLAPGDPILELGTADVGWVESFRGHRRLSLTIPVLSRARAQVWLICGAEKADIAAEVVDGRSLAPASRVLRRDAASLFLDTAAARRLSAG